MENNNSNSAPVNALSGKPYQGSNVPELAEAMAAGGYTDPRFMTFKQALELGRCVRKGQKAAARVVRWFPVEERVKEVAKVVKPSKKAKKAKGNGRMGSKSWAVFNWEQTDELPAEKAKAA